MQKTIGETYTADIIPAMVSDEKDVTIMHILAITRDIQDAASSMVDAVEILAALIGRTHLAPPAPVKSIKQEGGYPHSSDQSSGVSTNEIRSVASKLNAIIDLITTIAGHTNLLALNTTIEAARRRDTDTVVRATPSRLWRADHSSESISDRITHMNASFAEVLGSISNARAMIAAITRRHPDDDSTSGASHCGFDSADLIKEWRAMLADKDADDKTVYLAQADHLQWRKRLLDIVLSHMRGSGTVERCDGKAGGSISECSPETIRYFECNSDPVYMQHAVSEEILADLKKLLSV